jgi:hypothetical protein
MTFTVGAAATDDVAFSSATNMGNDNGSQFVCGWWYPTTLTAGRGYWSVGNIYGAEIDTTTSEIRMRSDNTTDGQWLTSGAGITTNKWWFLAWLSATENTTVAGEWRVWVGDLETAPVPVTVTNPVVRSGNYTSSSSVAWGNKGTGSLAFQGDIGWGTVMVTTTVGSLGPFGVSTSGVISAYAEELTYRRWVLPFWKGTPDISNFTYASINPIYQVVHNTMNPQGRLIRRGQGAVDALGASTINGVTVSNQREPIRLDHDWISFPRLVRR